ncbi:hypothetical protein ABPG72_022478 [Tetrahymena utriculariae]
MKQFHEINRQIYNQGDLLKNILNISNIIKDIKDNLINKQQIKVKDIIPKKKKNKAIIQKKIPNSSYKDLFNYLSPQDKQFIQYKVGLSLQLIPIPQYVPSLHSLPKDTIQKKNLQKNFFKFRFLIDGYFFQQQLLAINCLLSLLHYQQINQIIRITRFIQIFTVNQIAKFLKSIYCIDYKYI